MPHRRLQPLQLTCGRTVQLHFSRLDATMGWEPREGSLRSCASCGGERAHIVACGHTKDGVFECERRYPDCETYDEGAWAEAAIDDYVEHLRGELEGIASRVDQLEAEQMAALAELFARALQDDLIAPDDFRA